MNRSFLLAICTWLIVGLAVAFVAKEASAQLALFQTEMQAQLHCPNDAVVWLDFQKRRYYSQSQRLYGRGRNGTFVCLKEVRNASYRRSRLGFR